MNQINTDKLQHHGILGMKWGKRKAKYTTTSERKAIRSKLKQEQYEKKAKNNDARVELYGKTRVKARNAMGIAGTAAGMVVANQVVKSIGKKTIDSLWENAVFNYKRAIAKERTVKILTAVGIGAVTIASLKKMNDHRKDMQLADQYELRQYMKNQNKKK